MLRILTGAGAAVALAATVTIGGFATATAQSVDYTTLLVDPNVLTDSLAYTAAPLDINPNGQQGVSATYNHRDGRQITTTVLFFPDPDAATASLNGAAADVVNPKSTPAAVGTGGTLVSGMSPDGVQSVSVLTFTEGNAATTIEFDGPPNDPVPADMAVELGQKQDTQIKDWQSA
jgi:hypothetical protein